MIFYIGFIVGILLSIIAFVIFMLFGCFGWSSKNVNYFKISFFSIIMCMLLTFYTIVSGIANNKYEHMSNENNTCEVNE